MDDMAHDVDGGVLPIDKDSIPPDFVLIHSLKL